MMMNDGERIGRGGRAKRRLGESSGRVAWRECSAVAAGVQEFGDQ
jgi:hypothetical protein